MWTRVRTTLRCLRKHLRGSNASGPTAFVNPAKVYLPVVQPRGLACMSWCRASPSLPNFSVGLRIDTEA